MLCIDRIINRNTGVDVLSQYTNREIDSVSYARGLPITVIFSGGGRVVYDKVVHYEMQGGVLRVVTHNKIWFFSRK